MDALPLEALGPTACARLQSQEAARQAAERLERDHPGAEVHPVPLRDGGDGVEAVWGRERVTGHAGEVGEWLDQALPGATAGQDHDDQERMSR